MLPACCHHCLEADAKQHEEYSRNFQADGNHQGAANELRRAGRLRNKRADCPHISCRFHRGVRRGHLRVVDPNERTAAKTRDDRSPSNAQGPPNPDDLPVCRICWAPIVRDGSGWRHWTATGHDAKPIEESAQG